MGELPRRPVRYLVELVDDASLGQRVSRVEQPLVEESDVARPEAAEAASGSAGERADSASGTCLEQRDSLSRATIFGRSTRWSATPAITRKTPATSVPLGICVSTSTPMTVANAGSSETMSA